MDAMDARNSNLLNWIENGQNNLKKSLIIILKY
jgi:hypothetical protein